MKNSIFIVLLTCGLLGMGAIGFATGWFAGIKSTEQEPESILPAPDTCCDCYDYQSTIDTIHTLLRTDEPETIKKL